MQPFKTIGFLILLLLGGTLLYDNPAFGETAEETFYSGLKVYNDLLENSEKIKYRSNWLSAVGYFGKAYKKEPKGRYAAASLYMKGKLYKELYFRSFKNEDREASLRALNFVVKKFSKSSYKNKARALIKTFGKIEKKDDGPDTARHVKKKLRKKYFANSKAAYKASRSDEPVKTNKPLDAAAGSSYTRITGLRVWSNPSYTRIVVDADGETVYRSRFLEEDPTAGKPRRLLVDFQDSLLGENIEKIIPINNDLLMDARAGQFKPDTVRVVVDIKSLKHYKTFSLKNPSRIIIDVWGKEAGTVLASKKTIRKPPPAHKREPAPAKKKPPVKKQTVIKKNRLKSTLAKQLGLRVRRIVIDPGHGGKDVGAVGYYKKVHEKDVVLKIAKRLATKIRKKIGCQVIMTRRTDKFISLEERTAIANTKNADLFISIHTNAHKDRRANGIETYSLLNIATDAAAARVAARENATTQKSISDLESILADLLKNSKINESSRLAYHVQKSIYRNLKRKYKKLNNKGVKQAPFYVLVGAQMPAILVETSFITNKRECNRLTNNSFQEHLCNGIVKGIERYIRETNPTAMMRGGKKKG